MRLLSSLSLCIGLASCSVPIPDGQLQCAAAAECPPGYACLSARCYAPGTDAGEGEDVGAPPDTGLDAGLDASADGGAADAGAPEVFTDVACGNLHSCAITSMGRLFCWGDDRAGQVGEDATADTLPITVPNAVPGLTSVDEVGLGDDFTCARSAGSVYCWGTNSRGQLGDATVTSAGAASPHRIPSLSGVTALAVGAAHACAVQMGGAVRCWGQGSDGRLGNDTIADQRNPVAVPLPGVAIDVVAGLAHTCALLADRTVWCWGNNTRAELGVTAEPTVGNASRVPLLLTALPIDVEAIDAFAAHTCVRAGERLHCWGWNDSGELGSGSRMPTTSAPPVVATLPAGVVGDFGGGGAEYAFGGAHTCAIVGANLYCWGRGLSGEVGTGTNPFPPILTPTAVGLTGTTRVAGGTAHTCAVAEGAVYCWGANDRGRLGNGSETATNVPGEPIGVP